MAFLNSNNFCRWIDPSVNTELTTNSAFTLGSVVQADDWDQSDTAPVGDNEQVWLWSPSDGGYQNAIGAPDSTKGVSQEIDIKEGNFYLLEFDIEELTVKDTTFYVYFTRAGGNQLLQTVTINNTRQSYTTIVVADSDYSKIMGVFTTATDGLHGRFYELKLSLIAVDPCFYAMPLYNSDGLNIFANFVIDDSIVPFSGMKFGLWSQDLGIYLRDIATVNQVVISGDNYSVYFDEWVVPDLPIDNFRFIIYKESPDTILYLSNTFRKIPNINYTSWIKYNNAANTLGYLYESAPSFFNEFRIDIWTGRPNFNENVKGHDTYEGDLIRVKSDIQKLVNFQTRFLDDGAHEAFFSMLGHSNIEIDDIEYKKGEESYDIEWSEDDDNQIGNGVVNLLEVDYSAAIKTC